VDTAARACIPLEFPSVPAIVALSSLVGRSINILPEARDNWTVIPNLWGGIVARPGTLKTHALGAGLAPLGPLVERAHQEFESKAKDVQVHRVVLEAKLRTAKNRKEVDEERIRVLLAELEGCQVTERRYRTNNATVEKLGELLRENTRGMLLVRDELAGWLRELDRSGHEGDREFYLEAWNGNGSYTYDRISRGTVHIPALCVSVIGDIQPGKLATYLADLTAGENRTRVAAEDGPDPGARNGAESQVTEEG
jgi:putative DNA primase/helicase